MRTSLRLAAVVALGLTSLVVACSSSDDPATAPDTPDSGSSGSSSGTSGSSGSSSGSSGTSGGPTDAASDAPNDGADANIAFALTSTAFTEGGAIPLAQAQNCTNSNKMKINGMNESPPLAWTAGPTTTLSYAVEVHDASNNLVHSVIYDIPATVFALPGNLMSSYTPTTPAGAHEAKSVSGNFGYAGPCPPNQHTYEFILYAVDVATLPGTTMNTIKEDVVTSIKAHMLATTKLTGTFTP